jgi:hypothetical protein
VFAAANFGDVKNLHIDGHGYIPGPSGSKNLLVCGSLSPLQVDAERTDEVWVQVKQDPEITFRGVRAPWSRNVFAGDVWWILGWVADHLGQFKKTCMIAKTVDDLLLFNKSDKVPRCVLMDHDVQFQGNLQFPVFICDRPRLWDRLATSVKAPLLIFRAIHRPDTGMPPTIASFSGRGPTMLGIIKPEVVAPGDTMVAARSQPNGVQPAPDDPDPLLITVMMGTSMSTPNVAGALSLVEQYFLDRHYKDLVIVPGCALFRALAAATADPLIGGERAPNADSGFGQINLRRHLPFPGDGFAIHLGDRLPIGSHPHIVSRFTVVNASEELRVTIAYLDPPASGDAQIPLVCDLDLVVLSPSKRLFRGNHRIDDTEENYSTIERVIIFPAEVELGEYEVHVFAANPDFVEGVEFSIVERGGITIDSTFVQFEPATACLPGCGIGTCNTATFLCDCPAGSALGQSCQTKVKTFRAAKQTLEFEIPQFGLVYAKFENPEKATKDLEFAIKVLDFTGFYHIYTADGDPGVLPRHYERIDVSIYDNLSVVHPVAKPERGVAVLIRNDGPHPQRFRLDVKAANKGLSKGALIAIICVSAVVLVAVIVTVAYCCIKKRDGGGWVEA